jgi:chromosome segregation protein
MQLVINKSAMLNSKQQAIANERLTKAREDLRAIERQQQEADFAKRSVSTRDAELERVIQTARAANSLRLCKRKNKSRKKLKVWMKTGYKVDWQDALAIKLEREQVLAAKREVSMMTSQPS